MLEVVDLSHLFGLVMDKTKVVIIPSYSTSSNTSSHTYQVKTGSGSMSIERLLKETLLSLALTENMDEVHSFAYTMVIHYPILSCITNYKMKMSI
jgi:hypothetical protein